MKDFVAVLAGQRGGIITVRVENNSRLGTIRQALVDAVNTGTAGKRIQCPVDQVKLYLAKSGGSWLPSRDSRVQELCAGTIPESVQGMLSCDPLDPALSIRTICKGATPEAVIHILIVAARDSVMDDSKWETTPWNQHSYVRTQRSFQLDKADTLNSGLREQQCILYCRPKFHEQFAFFKRTVCSTGYIGWILGPEGTGKSCAALVFATTLDSSKWIVTWIHAWSLTYKYWCVRLSGGDRKTHMISEDEVEELLEAEEDKKSHLVLVDGWIYGKFPGLTDTCFEWFQGKGKSDRRRLAFICSPATLGRVQDNNWYGLIPASFFHSSLWSLEECRAAAGIDPSTTLSAPAEYVASQGH